MGKPEVIAVCGGQWGDEGKGKIVDFLAQDVDVVMRAQGGDNAGHTVVNPLGKFALHLIPAGIFNPFTENIIGAGVALNPKSLIEEMKNLEQYGIPLDNLKISPKAHLVFEYHQQLDDMQELLKGSGRIGTTRHGIGPAYMDKAERVGLRVETLSDPDDLLDRMDRILEAQRNRLVNKNFIQSIEAYLNNKSSLGALCDEDLGKLIILASENIPDSFYAEYYEELILNAQKMLAPLIADVDEIVQKHLENASRILIEGAHGTLLDLDHGTYPWVTSSNPTVAGLLLGSGIPPKYLTRSIGVFKAYQTRVGGGGMPTELNDGKGEMIRQKGHEFGTTTGRPRRVGYFDKVAFRYAMEINGFTDIALTRLDILSGVGDLKVCDRYEYEGQILTRFPTDARVLAKCKPVYRVEDNFEGWDVSGNKDHKYIRATVGKPSFIGTGERRENLIVVK